MKNLIEKIQNKNNQIKVLEKAQSLALKEIASNNKDASTNIHCQLVQDIAAVMSNKYSKLLKDVDVIAVADNHHNFDKSLVSAFYKTLDSDVEFEVALYVSQNENNYKNILWLRVEYDNYNIDAWGVDLVLRTKSSFINESRITNDYYRHEKINGFFTKGFDNVNIEQLIIDAKLLSFFNSVRIDLSNDVMAQLNNLDTTQKDNDKLFNNTRNTFTKAIRVIEDEIADLRNAYLSSLVGKSVNGGDICSTLYRNQNDEYRKVFKLDILKETNKSFRVNIHTCYLGYTNDGNKSKRYENVYGDVLVSKTHVLQWLRDIINGRENVDQVETYNEILKFKNRKSMSKIYESQDLDKLFKSKQFQSFYNELSNLYVSRPYSYVTNEKEIDFDYGCIWEKAHRWDYKFKKAILEYNPDSI